MTVDRIEIYIYIFFFLRYCYTVSSNDVVAPRTYSLSFNFMTVTDGAKRMKSGNESDRNHTCVLCVAYCL
jgi:hypothetical protein